jgi:hypothetical protein
VIINTLEGDDAFEQLGTFYEDGTRDSSSAGFTGLAPLDYKSTTMPARTEQVYRSLEVETYIPNETQFLRGTKLDSMAARQTGSYMERVQSTWLA